MDSMQREELERLMFFEQTREKAAADYIRSPTDPDNLTRWGGALLELAHFRQGQDSIDMVQDAVSKLEEALRINPRKHDALWCLGNAHTSQGFLVTETDKANDYFKKAARCFQQALDEEPHNELYQKALEMTEKAPSLHQELQKQLASQAAIGGGPAAGPVKQAGAKKKKDSDFKYDVMGWIVLAVGVIAWVGLAKSNMPPPPSPPSSLR
jgi:tetratricopeptide (TPR) repeat protein